MIPVTQANEPLNFNQLVRLPGLDTIARRVGEKTDWVQRGATPQRIEGITRREDIPADKFPDYWTRMLGDLHTLYGGICAYVAQKIDIGTGAKTVDHFVPKSDDWRLVYEWSNYRLSCAKVNSKKLDKVIPMDPFTLVRESFALEFTTMHVVPGPALDAVQIPVAESTISLLGLNDAELVSSRETILRDYLGGPMSGGFPLSYLEKTAPFIAYELRRQGKLLRGDR